MTENLQDGTARWQSAYDAQIGTERTKRNRSGVEIKPLYTPADVKPHAYAQDLGYPGQAPFTRGIYPTMHRGRRWSQRQLIGLGTPAQYNERLRRMMDAGANALSLIPCNSVYRGVDIDQVDREILATCGTLVNTVQDMDICLDGIAIDTISTALNDPLPFTMLAQLLMVAERRGVPLAKITGTSNQSDYISHFVANHMFYRLSLAGSRRVLTDHIEYSLKHLPGWNPLSVVGQHMQQAGATPAQAMGFTLSTALQYANDCKQRGMDPTQFLPKFTFFFDISISFFEEIAKFRAGRRIWARLVRERFGVNDARAQRFKFHAQTSGVDLTREQPLNNISRVATQAMAGIFGGLQSLHTDAYDEALSTPTEAAAQIAVATQNILCEEAGLADVIDPLGGSYYVESLTDQMEEQIMAVIEQIDAAGGMYQAVDDGMVQTLIGESAMVAQHQVDSGERTVVGVNSYRIEETGELPVSSLPRPHADDIDGQLERLADYKSSRDAGAVERSLDNLQRACDSDDQNLFASVLDATRASATQGEIIKRMRDALGFGRPHIIV